MASEGNLIVYQTRESMHGLVELILRQKHFEVEQIQYNKELFYVNWQGRKSLLRVVEDQLLLERNGALEVPFDYQFLRHERIYYEMWFEQADMEELTKKHITRFPKSKHIIVTFNPPRF